MRKPCGPRRRSGGCRIGGAGRCNPGSGRECGGAEVERTGSRLAVPVCAELHILDVLKLLLGDVQAADTMRGARSACRSPDLRDRRPSNPVDGLRRNVDEGNVNRPSDGVRADLATYHHGCASTLCRLGRVRPTGLTLIFMPVGHLIFFGCIDLDLVTVVCIVFENRSASGESGTAWCVGRHGRVIISRSRTAGRPRHPFLHGTGTARRRPGHVSRQAPV